MKKNIETKKVSYELAQIIPLISKLGLNELRVLGVYFSEILQILLKWAPKETLWVLKRNGLLLTGGSQSTVFEILNRLTENIFFRVIHSRYFRVNQELYRSVITKIHVSLVTTSHNEIYIQIQYTKGGTGTLSFIIYNHIGGERTIRDIENTIKFIVDSETVLLNQKKSVENFHTGAAAFNQELATKPYLIEAPKYDIDSITDPYLDNRERKQQKAALHTEKNPYKGRYMNKYKTPASSSAKHRPNGRRI
jgi:hypothetical protein